MQIEQNIFITMRERLAVLLNNYVQEMHSAYVAAMNSTPDIEDKLLGACHTRMATLMSMVTKCGIMDEAEVQMLLNDLPGMVKKGSKLSLRETEVIPAVMERMEHPDQHMKGLLMEIYNGNRKTVYEKMSQMTLKTTKEEKAAVHPQLAEMTVFACEAHALAQALQLLSEEEHANMCTSDKAMREIADTLGKRLK